MSKTKIIIILLLAFAVIGGTAYGFMARRQQPSATYDPSIQSEKQKVANQDGAQTTPNNASTAKDSDASKPSAQSATGTQASNGVNVDITTATQKDRQLLVRALVNGSTSGTCTLTLSQGQKVITKQAPLAAQASYVICQGFNVAVSELNIGDWSVKVTADTPQGSASATSKVSIE